MDERDAYPYDMELVRDTFITDSLIAHLGSAPSCNHDFLLRWYYYN